ncbi:acyl-CoA oxidase [Pseudoclavibacter chungangensis]|uniref:acyl-CoA dehydrogenase family protein n=1 Tax=Pseudoclavibacter chungangensis TaxID=587635 RepID=UPI0015C79F89|nr:acyl-CoA dehydrogenase [Pseudoclavibacter chungangensis]NYJ68630.1 acyl-CoA oxidase [Pseudoclavibacter chungangensis]
MSDRALNDHELDSPAAADQARIDTDLLGRRLLGRWADERLEGRRKAADPEYWRDDTLAMPEHRARTLQQLERLANDGAVNIAFPKAQGGDENHGGNIAGFEELVLADPSLQIKAGVQWGLFGAAVMHLGTAYHHETFLPGIMDFSVPGIYAMTETGHGSDVAAIGTTATYDEATQEWVVNTPFRGAWKDYLGNAALHGRAAVVFAKLITKGVDHGVHAFYVPVRGDDGEFLSGIGGEDDGVKGGLNGIDNGRLHFTQVRVPRRNLLNRYGDVAEDGTYSSPIESPGRRFFTMLGTLVQGRVSLDGASNAAAKAGLAIGVTYANQRRQFTAGDPNEEVVLLDYQVHQRRLLTRLATTYAVAFAHEQLLQHFHGVFSGEHDTPENREDLETLAAALKPLSTWHGLSTLQEMREACGGAGFLAENRVALLHHDLDIYTTFEGDNHVLLQLVGKRLLSDYAEQFKGADPKRVAQIVAGQAAERVFSGSGLRSAAQLVVDRGSTARSVGVLRTPDEQRRLLTDRVETMVADVAVRLGRAKKLSKAEGAAVFNENQHALIEASIAHGELLQWEAFTTALDELPAGSTKQVLTWVRDLFGLGLIERHLAWYLLNGRLSTQRGASVTRYIDRLLTRIRPHAQDLVDAFGYGPDHLRAKIASGAEAERQREAREYLQAERAAGRAPITEKALKARGSNAKLPTESSSTIDVDATGAKPSPASAAADAAEAAEAETEPATDTSPAEEAVAATAATDDADERTAEKRESVSES